MSSIINDLDYTLKIQELFTRIDKQEQTIGNLVGVVNKLILKSNLPTSNLIVEREESGAAPQGVEPEPDPDEIITHVCVGEVNEINDQDVITDIVVMAVRQRDLRPGRVCDVYEMDRAAIKMYCFDQGVSTGMWSEAHPQHFRFSRLVVVEGKSSRKYLVGGLITDEEHDPNWWTFVRYSNEADMFKLLLKHLQ